MSKLSKQILLFSITICSIFLLSNPVVATNTQLNKQIKTVQNCSNWVELEQFLFDNYNITVDKTVTYLNFQNVREVVSGITYTIDTVPELKGIITELNTYYFPKSDLGCSYDGVIYFNPIYYNKTNPRIYQEITKGIKQKYRFKNCNCFAVGVHEAAHFIPKLLLLQDDNVPKYQIQSKWTRSEKTAEIFTDIYKQYKGNKGKKSLYILRKNVSKYSLNNYSECFSECFADYVINQDEASELSVMLYEYLQDMGVVNEGDNNEENN